MIDGANMPQWRRVSPARSTHFELYRINSKGQRVSMGRFKMGRAIVRAGRLFDTGTRYALVHVAYC